MKRMSIAESTLKKQIDHVYLCMKQIDRDIERLNDQRMVYYTMITDLETEQTRLQAAWELASARNTKP